MRFKDRVGTTVQGYDVIKYLGRINGHSNSQWLCRCVGCSKTYTVFSPTLYQKIKFGCKECQLKAKKIGTKIDELTIIGRDGYKYLCLCSCGNIVKRSRPSGDCGFKHKLSPEVREYLIRTRDILSIFEGGAKKCQIAAAMGISRQRVSQLVENQRLKRNVRSTSSEPGTSS